jgi:hypothetical protein
MGEAALLIGGIMGATTAGISVASAVRQNQAIGRSMEINAQNAAMRQKDLGKRREIMSAQTLDQRRIGQLQQIKQANSVQGRVRAAAAMSGTSTGSGSAARSLEQVNTDRLFNQMVIDRNSRSQLMGINTQYTAGIAENVASFNALMAQLDSQTTNPWLAGIQGGITGLGTGLQIAGGLGLPPAFGGGAAAAPAFEGLPFSGRAG